MKESTFNRRRLANRRNASKQYPAWEIHIGKSTMACASREVAESWVKYHSDRGNDVRWGAKITDIADDITSSFAPI